MPETIPANGPKVASHHFLFSGMVMFTDPKDPERNIQGISLNAVVHHDRDTIPVAILGKAQQGLQLNFFGKVDDPNMQILDVVIISVVRLGFMTPEEFHTPPEGMEIQEIDMNEDRTVN